MSGIRCHECGAVVTLSGAAGRLAADGIKWTGDTAVKLSPKINIGMKSAVGIAGFAATSENTKIESGFLAEQYNNQQYKCINDHSGKWITNY
ncbi:unnamed protein product [Adineta ricciae]|uniref:Uncharacterized protein n=1 Tax=Adineta ricciae TaxID=249248 RepID=A0A816G419_ADIRI|nr:unnamed protein product [Adineta ricciae]CAF1669323.1 unnamed protein product [Adineta ricciae]